MRGAGTSERRVAVIGGGPAGLMAAERLAEAGLAVTVYDRMPSVGRKLLMAGRGGLNLTHTEALEGFLARYGEAEIVRDAVAAFPPAALVAWCEGLGEATFVGSSGRIFPVSFKASPLLRAWLARLRSLGVRFALRHRFEGWDESDELRFTHATGDKVRVRPDATLLAMGGASWPRLGSDGAWREAVGGLGIAVTPLEPANCGFGIAWSAMFRGRFAGTPLKRIVVSHEGERRAGEAMISSQGIEGGAVYALSARLRKAMAHGGGASLAIDLRPDLSQAELARRLGALRGSQSTATFLRKRAGLAPVAIALLREAWRDVGQPSPEELARRIKGVSLALEAPMAIERAISSAGGIALDELDAGFMLRRRPGLFAAGEMLDWEAPTGGYLLQASFATGIAAADGVLRWLGGCRSAVASRPATSP